MTRLPNWNADVAALTTAAIFCAIVWWMFHVVSQAGVLGRQVRDVDNARSAVMRAQLDEETGLRGYASTGHKLFLQPYYTGLRDFAGALARQRDGLVALGERVAPAALEATASEALLHGRWEREVATPLIAAPRRRDAAALQLDGKRLIDAFRDENARVVAALLRAAAAADVALQAALGQIVLFGVIGAVALIIVVRVATQAAERLRRDVVRQRALYEEEKRIAETLQKAFLQRGLPDVPTLDMHAVYVPAEQQTQVGGDWYDAVQLPGGKIFVSIGDVSGHGIQAAVVMSRARQSLLTLAALDRSPGEILEHVNRTLILQGQTMCTAICCFIDPDTLEIDYACAGHPPAVLIEPGGRAGFVAGHGIPLGIVDDARYASYALAPPPGSLLVLYTDGLVEYDHDLIGGERRLLKAVEHVALSGPADAAGALREATFGSGQPIDDVAVLTVRLRFSERDLGNEKNGQLSHPATARTEGPVLEEFRARQSEVVPLVPPQKVERWRNRAAAVWGSAARRRDPRTGGRR